MSSIGRGLRAYVYRRDKLRCKYCGVKCALPALSGWQGNPLMATIDHLVPQSRGGTSKPRNLTTACQGCNNKKADREAFVYRPPGSPLPALVSGDATRELARAIVRGENANPA